MTVQRRRTRSLAGARSYRAWKNWTDGDVFVGTFKSQSTDQFDKPNYAFEVVECDFAEEGENVEAGKTLVLNSSGSLDKAMESVDFGQTIEVVYQGTTILEKGKFAGKPCHTMEINEVVLGEESEEDNDSGL